jgi:hypothetical protein
MKINSKTVWQMTDDGMYIVAQDSHEYHGPVAQAFSTSDTTSITETTNIGIQDVQGIALGAGGDIEFNQQVTDLGAIQGAFDFADSISEQAGETVEQALGISAQAAQTVGEFTRSDTSQGLVKIAMFASLAVGVIFLARIFKGA